MLPAPLPLKPKPLSKTLEPSSQRHDSEGLFDLHTSPPVLGYFAVPFTECSGKLPKPCSYLFPFASLVPVPKTAAGQAVVSSTLSVPTLQAVWRTRNRTPNFGGRTQNGSSWYGRTGEYQLPGPVPVRPYSSTDQQFQFL